MAARSEAAGDGDVRTDRMRPSAAEIYERVKQDASEELERRSAGLAFSGLIAGATLGFSGVVLAATQVTLGAHPSTHLIGSLFYPRPSSPSSSAAVSSS